MWMLLLLLQPGSSTSGENMHYGVTFSAPGQEKVLEYLDKVLEYYSFFSLPTLVHGDKQKEAADRSGAPAVAAQDARGAAVVPISVVAGDGKQVHHVSALFRAALESL